MKKPLVSICCITYNHEDLIKRAIDSFLLQKVDFPIEIIISDDKSTDRTREIIRQSLGDKTELFKLVFHKKNMGAIPNFFDNISRATGKYIALCEGDDYWSDPNKLQKQVDYMEKHPDHALCFHPVRVEYEDKTDQYETYPNDFFGEDARKWTIDKLLSINFIQTNSVLYRRRESYSDLPVADFIPGDWFMHVYHAQFGRIGFINETMSVYNRRAQGFMGDLMHRPDAFWKKHAVAHMQFFRALSGLFSNDKNKQDIITGSANRVMDAIVHSLQEVDPLTIRQICEQFSEFAFSYIKMIRQREQDAEKEKTALVVSLHDQKRQLLEQDSQISKILSSNSYKIGYRATAPYRMFRRTKDSE